MTTTESDPEPQARRSGIRFYDPPATAPHLHEAGIMSMPTMDPPAPDQMMEWALSGGHVVKVLFQQGGDDGMSLVWSWFGPNYVLPRHSHSADCLYYVVSGEARLGNRTIPAGAGFFVPAGAPYAYAAGPEGIQVLEFRGISSFDMQITESLARWDRIVEVVQANKDTWQETAPDA
jgi:hypothetical protein